MTDTDVREDFARTVNMGPKRLAIWLTTDESTKVGQRKGGAESTGHRSGRRIVQILRKKKSELTEADEKHMAKVVGYVNRHLAQRPTGDVKESAWRYSLMNWGHDPLKTKGGKRKKK